LRRFALDFPSSRVDNAAGWFDERVSAAGAFLVGCLTLFQPSLLVGLHVGPFLFSPERETVGCAFFQTGDESWEKGCIAAI
jgi:hypothetical protein